MPTLLRRSAALLAALVFSLLTIAPAAHAAGFTIDTGGSQPGVAVDASGTGHIAYTTQTGSAFPYNYFVGYCRFPKGATTCADKKLLPAPGNLDPFDRTQVLVDGSRVILVAEFCCGTQDGVWAWVSTNGGLTFPLSASNPVRLSRTMSLEKSVLGPGPFAISSIGAVLPKYATGNLDGSTSTVMPFAMGDGLGPDPQGAYAGGAVGLLNSATPFVVVGDNTRLWFRKPDPSKSNLNANASWLPGVQFATDENEPNIASGPSGSFISSEALTNNPLGYGLIVRRVDDSGNVGAPQNVSVGQTPAGPNQISPHQSDIFEDGNGRVHAAYTDNSNANQLTYQWSKNGNVWGAPQILDTDDAAISNIQVGAAPDGSGFVVGDKVSGAVGPIKVYPFDAKGDSDPPVRLPRVTTTGTPAPTPTPGPPPAACPTQLAVSPDAKAMVRNGPCFKDLGKGKFSTTGSVRLAGIDFVPSGAATITVSTTDHTIATAGKVELRAGSIVLSRSTVNWDLDSPITIPDLGGFGVDLLGFKLGGTADVHFSGGDGFVHVYLDLPSPFNVARADTTMRTTMNDGLRLDNVALKATSIPIGPLLLENLDLVFSGGTNRFEGHVDVKIPPNPGKAVQAAFGMESGTIKHLDLEIGPGVPPLPLPLWAAPPVVLTNIGLHLKNDETGFRLSGGVKMALGGSVGGNTALAINAIPNADGSGNGAFLFVPVSKKYVELGANGSLDLFDRPLANGHLDIRSDGPITFGGGTKIGFGFIALDVNMEGGLNLDNGDFFAGGKGEGCVSLFVLSGCGHASAIASTIGFAACGGITLKSSLTGLSHDFDLGLDHHWGGDYNFGGCHYDEYKPASLGGTGSRLLAGGPQTITLGAGKTRAVHVVTAAGLAGFTFTGPGGRTITVPAGSTDPVVGNGIGSVPAGPNTVELQVDNPAGAWTLTPDATGPAVTQVLTADALPTATIKASVAKGAGTKRTVKITAGNLGTQTLMIREVLPGGGASEIGTVKKNGKTTLSFTPTTGLGGKREIQAVVLAGTRQVEARTIATYTAPAPKPLVAPKSVTLKRTKTAVTARWKKVTGAGSYRISIKASDGRLQFLTAAGKATSIVIPDVTPDDKVSVQVAGVTALGAVGKSKAATSAAIKTKKPKKKKSKKA